MPSFAVDDGFAYTVPDGLSDIGVGTMVRVPLGGRRVRGFVTALRHGEPDRPLRDVLGRSGDLPVFDEALLQTARWVAAHYVAPLSVVLGRCAPPNLPKTPSLPSYLEPAGSSAALAAWASAQATGRKSRSRYVISGEAPVSVIAPAIGPIAGAGRTVAVAAPTIEEAADVASALTASFGDRVRPAAERTETWALVASGAGTIVVGTREIAFWGAGSLGLGIVIEEGRRAYKAKQTPTYHVRDVWRRRSGVERFGLLFVGAVPTTDIVAAGVEISADGGRVWPLVDIVDRREDPGALFAERTRMAIASTVGSGGSVFVMVNRRGYAGAFRCVSCRELRRCTNCGAGLERSGTCPRCGREHDGCSECGGQRFEPIGAGIGRVIDELARSHRGAVGEVGSGLPVQVGTERDLVGLAPVALAIAADADGMLLAPHYRAGEDALRRMVRMTMATSPGRGRKAIVQTALPGDPAIVALQRGRPMGFIEAELVERAKTAFPPVGALLAVETDAPPGPVDRALREAGGGAIVLGPSAWGEGHRWLFQADNLDPVRLRLRSVVQALRDGGSRVRVDADPVDL